MKDYDVKTYKLPDKYDINFTKLENAFNKVKQCVYCGSQNVEMYYKTNRDYEDELLFYEEFTKKTKHYISCTCHNCGAKYGTQFTTKNIVNLKEECKELYCKYSKYAQDKINKNPISPEIGKFFIM